MSYIYISSSLTISLSHNFVKNILFHPDGIVNFLCFKSRSLIMCYFLNICLHLWRQVSTKLIVWWFSFSGPASSASISTISAICLILTTLFNMLLLDIYLDCKHVLSGRNTTFQLLFAYMFQGNTSFYHIRVVYTTLVINLCFINGWCFM